MLWFTENASYHRVKKKHFREYVLLSRSVASLVLPDSEELYAQATRNIVEKYGKTFDWPTRVTIMGMTGVERSKKLVELLDLPITWEEYYNLALEQHKQLMRNVPLMPGML